MGKYAQSILTTGEHVVYEARLSLLVFFWSILIMVILLAAAIISIGGKSFELFALSLGICAICGICDYLIWTSSEFVITNRRIILKTGIVSRKSFEMRLEKVESIALDQSIAGRILNYGSLTITGTGDTSRTFNYLKDPMRFKLAAEQEISNRQQELQND